MAQELIFTDIPFGTDKFVRLKDPEDTGVDETDANRLLVSGVASFKVYDPNVDVVMTAFAGIAADSLAVSNAGLFSIGQRVEILMDDGGFHNTTIDSVDTSAGRIGIAAAITVGADIDNRVRRIFVTASVAMSLFGTPKVGDKTWGYRGVLSATGLHLILNQKIIVEMILNAGTGLQVIENLCLKVVEKCE